MTLGTVLRLLGLEIFLADLAETAGACASARDYGVEGDFESLVLSNVVGRLVRIKARTRAEVVGRPAPFAAWPCDVLSKIAVRRNGQCVGFAGAEIDGRSEGPRRVIDLHISRGAHVVYHLQFGVGTGEPAALELTEGFGHGRYGGTRGGLVSGGRRDVAGGRLADRRSGRVLVVAAADDAAHADDGGQDDDAAAVVVVRTHGPKFTYRRLHVKDLHCFYNKITMRR